MANDDRIIESTTNMRQIHSIENFIIIWLDLDINEFDEDTKKSLTSLRQVVDSIKIFNNVDQCIDYLTDIEDEKVFLIISHTLHQQIVSLIENIAQLHSIYVVSSQSIGHGYKKVKGIFNKIESICDVLQRNLRQYEIDLISIGVSNLDELDQSFMYSQILKEILLDIKYDLTAKKEFVDFCSTYYADNHTQTNRILDFERFYGDHSPIWWYTKETFIYSILNKALRTQEIDVIIKMGFFIQDLHRQIEQLYATTEKTSKMTVYRGQGMSDDDFAKIKKSEGGLLSFNNFLSTSLDQAVSLGFAESTRENCQLTGILYQIEIDSSISTVSFASLDNVSYYSDSEKEILFSMHTIFRIGEIKELKDRLWQVNLTLTNDNDQQLKQLMDHLRKENQGKNGWYRIAILMMNMGKFNKALEVFNLMCEKEQVITHRGIYHDMAVAYQGIGDYSNALLYYEKALEIQRKFLPANHPEFITTYNNIGSINNTMGYYPVALSYFQRALEIQKNCFPNDHASLAVTNNNIAAVNESVGDYQTALCYYKQALKIEQQSLPSNHPSLAVTYEHIGSIYGCMGDYSTALSYHKKVVEIQQKILPPDHPNLATSYKNIAHGYRMLCENSEALAYCQKTLEIEMKSLPSSHPSFANTYRCMAAIYYVLGNYSSALSYYEKALEINQRSFPSDHPSIALIYRDIGSVYESMEDYSKALTYYKKALYIGEKSLPANHPSLAHNYNNIGSVYDSMRNYPLALEYYQKALDILQKAIPPNHADLANTYNYIALVYQSKGDDSTALSYYQKTIDMKEIASHPYNQTLIATAYNNIGELHRWKGEYSIALSYFEKTRLIWQNFFPPNHYTLATLNGNMAETFKGLGQYKAALQHAEQAVTIARCAYGFSHPRTITYKKLLDDLQRQ